MWRGARRCLPHGGTVAKPAPSRPASPGAAAAQQTRMARGGRGNRLLRSLTFTCHFCLRQTPHWGGVARECPAAFRRFRRAKAASLLREKASGKRCAHLCSRGAEQLPRSPSVIGLRPLTAPSRREPRLGCCGCPPGWAPKTIREKPKRFTKRERKIFKRHSYSPQNVV